MYTAPEDGTHIIVSHEELGEVEMYYGDIGHILGPGWITVPDGILCPRLIGWGKFKGWRHKDSTVSYSDITRAVL
jgi:hypothetical protein